MKLCRKILHLQQQNARGSSEGPRSQRAQIIVLLHILHPLLAQIFYETENPTMEEPALAELAAPTPAQDLEQTEALQRGPTSREAMQLGAQNGGHTVEEARASEVEGPTSKTAWKESSLWLFLLGNTLLRLLDLIGLPRFGIPEQQWPPLRYAQRDLLFLWYVGLFQGCFVSIEA